MFKKMIENFKSSDKKTVIKAVVCGAAIAITMVAESKLFKRIGKYLKKIFLKNKDFNAFVEECYIWKHVSALY